MRLAGQRLLALSQGTAIDDAAVEMLERRLGAARDYSAGVLHGTPSPRQRALGLRSGQGLVFVGPNVDGLQMGVRAQPASVFLPETPEDAQWMHYRQGEQLALSQAALQGQRDPRAAWELQFGWLPVQQNRAGDVVPTSPKMSYEKPSSAPVLPTIGADIQAAMPVAMQQAGVQPGDLVLNTPKGIHHGDYRRAISYMRYGFGPVQGTGEQMAVVTPDYGFAPTTVFQPSAEFLSKMGWA